MIKPGLSHDENGGGLIRLSRRKLNNLKVKPIEYYKGNSPLLRKVGEIKWHFFNKMEETLGFDPSVGSLSRSEFDPNLLLDGIARYDGLSVFNPDKKYWSMAFNLMKKRYQEGRLQAIPYDKDYIYQFIKPNTSAGYPYKGMKKDEVYSEAYDAALSVSEGRSNPNPCTAFARCQGRKSKTTQPKVRLVWGYPLEMIIMESRYAIPLLDHFQNRVTTCAMGMRKFQLGTKLETLRYYPVIYKSDWSKFDATVPSIVINQCFDILKSLFEDVDEDYEVIKRYFCTCGIVAPTDELITRRRRGIPSGSFFTSIIGTMVNEFLTTYLLLRENVSWDGLYLGDDSIVGLSKPVNTTRMKDIALQEFGMVLDTDKLNYGKTLEFLGHYWENGRPFRPIEESLRRLSFPERWNPKVHMADLLSSLYGDNVSLWHVYNNRIKEQINLWSGPDLSGFAVWDKSAKVIRSELLTL